MFKNWSNLLKQSKKGHFNNLNVKDLTKNKRFWKTIKPFFTEKNKTTNNIVLTENNNQIVREDKTIYQIINTYFGNVTKGLQNCDFFQLVFSAVRYYHCINFISTM